MDMEFGDFKVKFAELLEETEVDSIVFETKLRELEEWSSLMVLSIIGMVDEAYNIKVKGSEISKLDTIGDLVELIKLKSRNDL